MLDEVGFAPQADARSSVVRLTRCPLLEEAHRYPDVDGTELLPFAEPGACRLHLRRPR